MKKFDIIIIVGILIVAAGLYFFYNLASKEAENVLIRIDGEVTEKFPLAENRHYKLVNDYGENDIYIENFKVYVKSSDCKNKVCVKQGKINRAGESIICLPHHLSIEITGEKDDDIDVIAQ